MLSRPLVHFQHLSTIFVSGRHLHLGIRIITGPTTSRRRIGWLSSHLSTDFYINISSLINGDHSNLNENVKNGISYL